MKLNQNMDELLESVYSDEYEDDFGQIEYSTTVKKESAKDREDFHKFNINKHKKPIRIDKRSVEYNYD